MRLLLVVLVSGIFASATIAFAGEPPMPSTRLLTGPQAGSNLPDLGSPAANYL